MSHTKNALVALLMIAYDNVHGPAWVRLLFAVLQLACAVYLAWYVLAGPEPVERKQARR
jgi:hypothetical protein